MRTPRLTGFTFTLLLALDASAQATPAAPPGGEPAQAEQPAASTAAPSTAAPSTSTRAQVQLNLGASAEPMDGSATGDAARSGAEDEAGATGSAGAVTARTGFETGLRIGVGIPVGRAGQEPVLPGVPAPRADRDLKSLAAWRAPLWIDVGYRLSDVTTLGAYGQVGVGGNGGDCIGQCDWSDLRIGAQAQWRLAPGSRLNPWLGVGAGYEWLSFRTLLVAPVQDPGPNDPSEIIIRVAERLGGPELFLQAGLDFVVEDALSIGPYASATVGQYLSDGFNCPRAAGFLCPEGSSIEGSGFHSWLGIGLRGSYVP